MSEEQQKEAAWEEQVFETLMDPNPDSFLAKRIPWTPPSTAPINPSINPTSLLDSLDKFDEIVERFKEINVAMCYPMPSWCVSDSNLPLVIRAVLKAYTEVYAKP